MHAHVRRALFAVVLLLTSGFARAQPDAGGVLRKLSIASLGGSGQTSIQALATDSIGNILVAGTTNAPDFPVKNASQPVLADATILRTSDLGITWTHVGSPQAGPKIAAILSVVESCRRLRVSVRNYLASVLPGLADLPIQRLPELTPSAWVTQHPFQQRPVSDRNG